MRRVHLICNAHIDPVWQWGWPEGLGVILSTFRVAADFCEEFDNFVFNHNEALLYKCIEEFDPALFDRIKALVKAGKWRIMGGWYLQPDCNMLSGESIVRQISASRKYFMEKFGVKVTTAVNMDSFGHSRGLVQILQQAGYTGYLFMRPDAHVYTFEEFEQGFRWKGYCDSEIKGYRLNTSYNTIYGTAAQTIRDYIYSNKNPDSILRCWGIGDHGGGPSRVDIIAINELIENECENEIIHSSPDDFMGELDINRLPVFSRDLNPIFVGCYTTMANVKKLHRRLENNLAFAEKVSSVCDIEGLVAYPDLKIKEAYEDLMFCQFHDVIAGTCTKPVERQMVQKLSHGLEITDNIILKAFYALSKDQKAAEGTNIPILVLNPHPYEVSDVFECEYMLADQNYSGTFTSGTVHDTDGKALPSQIEREDSNINLDWRKKICFYGTLKPMSINRFDIRLMTLNDKPDVVKDLAKQRKFVFNNGKAEIVLDTSDGSIESYKVDSKEYISAGLGQLLVYKDNADPWLLTETSIDELIGRYTLLDEEKCAEYAGALGDRLSPVRVVEDGDVRTVIEVCLGYKNSRAKVLYKFSKHDASFDMEVTINNCEKDCMVRLNIPHNFEKPYYTAQDMFGTKVLTKGREMVIQKWVSVYDNGSDRALSVINDCVYGAAVDDSGVKLSLLRTPTYTFFNLEMNPPHSRELSYPRIDRGERVFNFTVMASDKESLKKATDIKAQYKNEYPVAVSCFPSGSGKALPWCFKIEGVRMDTFKKSDDGKAYILRLFNYREEKATARVVIERFHIDKTIDFKPLEIKTLRVNDGEIREVNLIDEV